LNSEFSRLWEDPLAAAANTPEQPPVQPSELINIRRYFAEVAYPASARKNRDKPFKFLCLPVMVPGGPYADSEEQRKRIRYALLAALTTHGYRMALPQRMSWVRLPIWIDVPAVGAQKRTDVVVPVKIFTPDIIKGQHGGSEEHDESGGSHVHDSTYDRILVCWINETQIGGRPLCAMSQILIQLFGENELLTKRIDVKIVGPTSSDTLLSMAAEDAKWRNWQTQERDASNEEGFLWIWDLLSWRFNNHAAASNDGFGRFRDGGATLFSPRATIEPDSLRADEETDSKQQLLDFTSGNRTLSRLRVARTIGTDGQLIEALKEELKIRNAWPDCEESKKHIILIYERDTLYGRAIEQSCLDTKMPPDNLHSFTYLRGIDGKIPDPEKAKSEAALLTGEKVNPLPQGHSQLDYLRRLQVRIADLETELSRDGHEVAAIGVVGTDLYDKLLVLRALRPHFHGKLFFTTDLDARLSHPSEYTWTRNLLVASHFGLSLNSQSCGGENLQHHVAPFRDSYQTALFFTTMMLLEDHHIDDVWVDEIPTDPWNTANADDPVALRKIQHAHPPHDCNAVPENKHLQPLVFEIARGGAYQLTTPGADSGRVSSFFDSRQDRLRRSASARIHPTGPRGEPMSSVVWSFLAWSIALMMLGVCLLVNFTVLRQAIGQWRMLRWVLLGAFAIALITTWETWRPNGEPFALFSGISIWPTTLLRLLALLLSIQFIAVAKADLERNRKEIAEEYFGYAPDQCRPKEGSWKALLSHLWGKKDDSFRERCRKAWATVKERIAIWSWLRGDDNIAPARLFQEYTDRAHPLHRDARTLAISFCYFLFYALMFSMAGFASMPGRSVFSVQVGWVIATIAGFLMVYLTFYVIDATQLCKRFVRKLADTTYGWPPNGIDIFCNERGTVDPKEDIQELIKIRIIANRTHHVSKLIKYPFIVILITIVARHSLFDNWSWPWTLVILLAIILSGAVLCGILLRKECVNARKKILRRLSDKLSAAVASDNKARVEQTKQMIAEVEQIQDGAFRPLQEDPVLQALAIPFGGVGGLVLIERMLSQV
jgi:hypothetical protein